MQDVTLLLKKLLIENMEMLNVYFMECIKHVAVILFPAKMIYSLSGDRIYVKLNLVRNINTSRKLLSVPQ